MQEIIRFAIIIVVVLTLIFISGYFRREKKDFNGKIQNKLEKELKGKMFAYLALTNGTVLICGDYLIERFGLISFYVSIGLALLFSAMIVLLFYRRIKKCLMQKNMEKINEK